MTWTRLDGHGLPSGTTGRIALAIAPSDRKRIYALIESSEGVLWRSDDARASWSMGSSNTLANERPFYYSRILVAPHHAHPLFSALVKPARSQPRAQTWPRTRPPPHRD